MSINFMELQGRRGTHQSYGENSAGVERLKSYGKQCEKFQKSEERKWKD